MIRAECHLWGKKFSPDLLKSISGIKIQNSNEPNEIGIIGRFKNKVILYGSCSIITPNKIKSNKIVWMARFIIKHKSEFEKAGATEFDFWIYWQGKQGNMEFTVEELKLISETKIPLSINYVYE